MNELDLMEKIKNHAQELPKVRSVTDVYVRVMALIANKLTQDELEAVIALGALVDDRSSRMIPVLRWEQIEEMDLGRGRPVV